ncbi:MAG: glycosyltransferase family 4 protein [Hyphomicrobiales bacterium]|nr:glycosyltransferase family 4 protein [Hyphomicrobiales bacterium]
MIAIATQCFGPDFGGIEMLMTSLADELARNGHGVEVFADRIRRSGAPELVRPYPVHRFGLLRPVRRYLKRRALQTRATNTPFSGVFVDSWKSVAAIPEGIGPIAMLAHGNEIPRDIDSSKAHRVRHALTRVRTIVASSRFTADLAGALLQGSPARVVVINPPLLPQEKARSTALKTLDVAIAGRSPIISTLCRLEPRKGVDMVLRVLPRLRERFPNILYLVAGAGDDLQRLQEIAVERGVADSVVFLGPLGDQEKAAFFERSDVFAMPVRRVGDSVEGFGIVYAEAAWRGAPSVAGVEGGAADAVLEGETGLLCRGDDERAVFEALNRLLGDETLRSRLGAAARQHAVANLSWNAALPRYLDALGL